jgi:hypothetical protein
MRHRSHFFPHHPFADRPIYLRPPPRYGIVVRLSESAPPRISRMKCIFHILLIPLAALALATALDSPCRAEEGALKLEFRNGSVSANLEEAPLKDVMEKIKAGTDIWIKGAEVLDEDTVSMEFEDLSVEHALERILSALNYSLVFDDKSRLVGVFIVGRAEQPVGTRKRPQSTRTPSPRSAVRDFRAPSQRR